MLLSMITSEAKYLNVLAETGRVVVPSRLGISKRFKNWVGGKDLTLHFAGFIKRLCLGLRNVGIYGGKVPHDELGLPSGSAKSEWSEHYGPTDSVFPAPL
jgi:hypothetical protein